jgi:predicted anti-sigma-YlaC factor YlaD
MNAFNMTCEAVEVTLPDYLDETLEAWVRTSVQEHLSECVRCAGLVRDLRNLEREAAALPDLVPEHDLWTGIASRIGAPVLTLASASVAPVEPASTPMTPTEPTYAQVIPIEAAPSVAARRKRLVPLWMGAAAAALVLLTAGTTYLLTSRAVRPAAANVASAVPAAGTSETESVTDSGIAASPPASADAPDISGAAPARPRGASPAPDRGIATLASRSPAEAVYEKEIDMLQAIMSWRKSELDPSTAAIIEKNLRIIDAAIAESKKALRNDPASSMLTHQLSNALDKKVELLRTAAMLPART